MSLKIWLPLDGNLKNQGTAGEVVWTNHGATVGDNGKIGHCYNFNGSNNYLSSAYNPYNNNYTITAWIYTKTTSATQTIICNRTAVGSGLSVFLSNSGKIRIDAGGNTQQWITNYAYPANKWFHLAITYNGNKVVYYINGEFKEEKAQTVSSTYWYNFTSIGASQAKGSSLGNYLNGSLNDIRFYNRVLSKLEIKEIAQALVLHYKFNDASYTFNGENLLHRTIMRPEDREDFMTNNPSSGEVDVTKEFRFYNGSASIHSFALSDECDCYEDTILLNSASNLGISFIRSQHDILLDPNVNYTLSCEAKCTSASLQLAIGASYHNGSKWVWRGGSNAKSFGTANTWKTFSYTFKPDADTVTIGYCFTVKGTSGGTNTVTIRKCKLEKGSTPTPWAPSYEEGGLANKQISDSSGYKRDGFIGGAPTVDATTKKYDAAIHFSSTGSKIKVKSFPTAGFGDSYTFAWWGKVSSWSTMFWGFKDGIKLNGIFQGKLWNTGDSNNNPLYKPGTTTAVAVPSTNTWYYWVMTGDGTKCRVYQNGILWGEAKTYKSISGSNIYINGWNGLNKQGSTIQYGSNNMSISDFRIYATALSAEDILQLYNTPTFIDKNGSWHTKEFYENELGKELIAGQPLTNHYHARNPKIAPYDGDYTNDGEIYLTSQTQSIGSNYIKINPNNKIYYYDIEVSFAKGNMFYIGFERYDANKTSRTNNACVYVISTRNIEHDIIHQRYKGTLDLATDGVNPTDTIALRILNWWSNSSAETEGWAIIHYLSLREVDANSTFNYEITKTGLIKTDTFRQWDDEAHIYKNGFIAGNNLIEN